MHPGTAQLIHIQCHQPVGNKTQCQNLIDIVSLVMGDLLDR